MPLKSINRWKLSKWTTHVIYFIVLKACVKPATFFFDVPINGRMVHQYVTYSLNRFWIQYISFPWACCPYQDERESPVCLTIWPIAAGWLKEVNTRLFFVWSKKQTASSRIWMLITVFQSFYTKLIIVQFYFILFLFCSITLIFLPHLERERVRLLFLKKVAVQAHLVFSQQRRQTQNSQTVCAILI